MITRKITIVSTKTQKKDVLTTDATTLGELKRDMNNARIDYEGMTFYEGLTKTELLDNDSLLPSNVPYKGTITNDLVFMLTNPNKKIKSGAYTRAELYAKIKEYGLKDKVLSKFNKNFTQCKTSDLEEVVSEYEAKFDEVETTENKPVVKVGTTKVENSQLVISNMNNFILEVLDAVCEYLNNEEFTKTIDTIKAKYESEKTEYTDSEIDEMFNFVDR